MLLLEVTSLPINLVRTLTLGTTDSSRNVSKEFGNCKFRRKCRMILMRSSMQIKDTVAGGLEMRTFFFSSPGPFSSSNIEV